MSQLQTAKNRWSKPRFVWLAGLLLLIGVCLGFAGGAAYYWAFNSGRLTAWVELPAPPAELVELVRGDISVVYGRSADGTIYACEHQRDPGNTCWYVTQEPLAIDPDTRFDEPVFGGVPEPPAGEILDALDATNWIADAVFETRYVLLADQRVWKWESDRGITGVLLCFLGPLTGALIGLLGAAILWLVVARRSG